MAQGPEDDGAFGRVQGEMVDISHDFAAADPLQPGGKVLREDYKVTDALPNVFVETEGPHHIVHAVPTWQNQYTNFLLVQGSKSPWPGWDMTCEYLGFCIPCTMYDAKCEETKKHLDFTCRYEGGLETHVAPPLDCNKPDECDENSGSWWNDQFFGNDDSNYLSLTCATPPAVKARLDAGESVNVTLLHTTSGKGYNERVLRPLQAAHPAPPEKVELAGVLYFNLHYHNNIRILQEWMQFMQLQGVGHFYIYYYSDEHFECKVCNAENRARDPVRFAAEGCEGVRHGERWELDPEDDPKGSPELKGHAAMLTKFAEAGKVTLVDWPMNTWCSQSPSEDMNCQVCENAGRQTGIINYHMNRYRDTSTFTTFCDVDEWMFGFGGTLNLLRALTSENMLVLQGNYNNWYLDNTTAQTDLGKASSLYISNGLNRYYYDPGFAKYICHNNNTWFGGLHAVRGRGFQPGTAPDGLAVDFKFRTNHHRHGAIRDKMYEPLLKERIAAGPSKGSAWDDVYGPLLKCLEQVASAEIGSLSVAQTQAIGAPCFAAEKDSRFEFKNSDAKEGEPMGEELKAQGNFEK
jgi:hypothetical protein